MCSKSFALIIPAAGIGKRMGADVPKPYLVIEGKTILEHTLSRFTSFTNLEQVIVSTSERFKKQTEEILAGVFPGVNGLVVQGGAERQDSIRNALGEVYGHISLVAVHDAVRPFVNRDSISKCLNRAEKSGAAIVGVPVKDTIKKVDEDFNIHSTPERKYLWQAQTPQIFDRTILMEAYNHARTENILGTDDASLVEISGPSVSVVEGNRNNFKLTYPLDFEIAKTLLKKG